MFTECLQDCILKVLQNNLRQERQSFVRYVHLRQVECLLKDLTHQSIYYVFGTNWDWFILGCYSLTEAILFARQLLSRSFGEGLKIV